ncbi:CcdC protein domain-containing protein [Sandaracinobacteroides saxicola]|uniref:DUF1453 family protein n=1 Tax=Sandaracinobacteroides saxicola TaxID=2759707 RepID=A0A7G5IGP4_9SPHN|nr:CcdC protein domain-containing protein [Sandaracinobacteroides saxicola]QMW22536.1 DUF1453 family protein [Sandaracinobacteroides saxicola]
MTLELTPQAILPLAIPVIVVIVILIRSRRHRRVHAERLWIMPALVTPLILLGLWFQPHPAPSILTVTIALLGIAGGIAFGTWRSRMMTLSRDPGTGAVMMAPSRAALLVILAMFAVRNGLRWMAGDSGHPGAAALAMTDALMLFALAMIISQRVMLWRRIRALPVAG